MRMTTPNEFLEFAKEMGLGQIKSTSSLSSITRSVSKRDSYTSTGLSVLNNLCRLIEQIHQLKSENHRLRAHLDLVEHVHQFQNHFRTQDNLKSMVIHDRTRSDTIPLTKPTKIQRSLSNRERKGKRSIFFHIQMELKMPRINSRLYFPSSHLILTSVIFDICLFFKVNIMMIVHQY